MGLEITTTEAYKIREAIKDKLIHMKGVIVINEEMIKDKASSATLNMYKTETNKVEKILRKINDYIDSLHSEHVT